MDRKTKGQRFANVTMDKADGATYTPRNLAKFVGGQIIRSITFKDRKQPIHVLDPAVGEGELLLSILEHLVPTTTAKIVVHGYDTNAIAMKRAEERILTAFSDVEIQFEQTDFLDVVQDGGFGGQRGLFDTEPSRQYDLIIANPPYIRTQVMGASRAQDLAQTFALTGRVDIYYAFLLGIASVLKPDGAAGVIVSNRFMSTRSGESIRRYLRSSFVLSHIWDFGDTKLFEAAVLPAVLLLRGKDVSDGGEARFTTIYETAEPADLKAGDPIEALEHEGIVQIDDGRRFLVKQGRLSDSDDKGAVWRIATQSGDSWLAQVQSHAWGRFGEIGKIRVGVKTCADKVFIGDDWDHRVQGGLPELLRPLTTHHSARRFKALPPKRPKSILYPHETVDGERRAVDISKFPQSQAYLESHRETLEGRSYVLQAGRKWYEIWVPQDPGAWQKPKLVFRDIAEEPVFWIDLSGSVVNGDCYWIVCDKEVDTDLLWLAAAVANSTFIEAFYDHSFNNKLYAGRRRFITQYVEQFPLPDPESHTAHQIIASSKRLHDIAGTAEAEGESATLESLIWQAFGLRAEKV